MIAIVTSFWAGIILIAIGIGMEGNPPGAIAMMGMGGIIQAVVLAIRSAD